MNKEHSIRINLFYNIAYQALVVVISLITTPYVSRVLGLQIMNSGSNHHLIFTLIEKRPPEAKCTVRNNIMSDEKKLESYLTQISNTESVAIHIRRGDYITKSNADIRFDNLIFTLIEKRPPEAKCTVRNNIMSAS